jgi:hypothetical protein
MWPAQARVARALELESTGDVPASSTNEGAEGAESADAGAKPAGGAKSAGFQMPPFSVRFDPFNWLIAGRLSFEFEVAVWKFISVELVPVMIVNTEPASIHFGGREEAVSQHSGGLGPLAGASLGVAFWLLGTPLQGYVARLSMTNIGVTYEASNESGVFDTVDTVERQIQLYLGSHSRFGVFTVGGGLGVGYELVHDQRCFVNRMTSQQQAVTAGCDGDALQILLDPQGNRLDDLHGPFHPFYLIARFSIGVAFN